MTTTQSNASSPTSSAPPTEAGAEAPRASRATAWTVGLLAVLNGAAILSMEILGGRVLQPDFGSGLYVWGSILSVFMVSLSIGYWAGGRISAKRASLAGLMVFPLVGGCMIFALPYVYGRVNEALFELVVIQWESRESYASLMAATVEFLLPSAVLGCVAPYSVRLLARTVSTSGRTAGNLYALSTVGSAAGALVTSFWLVPWKGAETLFRGLGGGLVALAVTGLIVAALVSRRRDG